MDLAGDCFCNAVMHKECSSNAMTLLHECSAQLELLRLCSYFRGLNWSVNEVNIWCLLVLLHAQCMPSL